MQFGLGGAAYEIELSKKNARAFRKQLVPYIEHAREAGPVPRRRPEPAPARSPPAFTASQQRAARPLRLPAHA